MEQRPAVDLVLVRHGQTAWNALGRYQGRTDVPLDDVGRAQAAALATLLRDERFAVAVDSGLLRARETAAIVTAPHALRASVDARWREFDFGAWEGLTWPQIDGGRWVRPAGGSESFDDVIARVTEALEDLRAALPHGGTALVVTHNGPLHALVRRALGSEDGARKIRFVPASVTRMRLGAALEIVRLNETPP